MSKEKDGDVWCSCLLKEQVLEQSSLQFLTQTLTGSVQALRYNKVRNTKTILKHVRL